MTSLLGLSIAFGALTLVLIAGLVALLRRRGAAGRRAAPDHAGEESAMPSLSREES